LLVQDKIVIKKRTKQKPRQEKPNPKLPDIMGQPKPRRSLLLSNSANESQKKKQEQESDNFESEIEENDFDIEIPQEELDDVFRNMPDFEEEEEEWNRYGISSEDDSSGFALGVTFEELSTVGMLLQKENLAPSQKETAVAIVQKIQGTELFSLLENSIESASRKIAELLDGSLSSETNASSSTLQKNDLENFDIGEFL
jgi:hypothetical protein